jgi:hypothetical protein
VGSAGQWVVTGDDVQPVHVYLVFDGRQVHVALAAAGTDVRLAGARIGADWVKAPVPCELRFGGACLILRYAPRATAPIEEERTVHDGGALWQAAQRAAQGTGAPPLGPQFPATRPAAGAPANFGSTLPLIGAPVRITEAYDEATTVRSPLVGGPPPEAPVFEQDVTRIAPQPREPLPPEPPRPIEAPSPEQAARAAAERTANTTPGAADPLAFWRSASLAKKATLVLMPFALVASYSIFQPDAPPPAPRSTVPAATARQATGARDASASDALAVIPADSPGVDPATLPAPSPDPPPKLVPLPAGKRTPERLALDAVAAGSFDEASRLYATLAAAHPDDPSYKEAARILREKTGSPR